MKSLFPFNLCMWICHSSSGYREIHLHTLICTSRVISSHDKCVTFTWWDNGNVWQTLCVCIVCITEILKSPVSYSLCTFPGRAVQWISPWMYVTMMMTDQIPLDLAPPPLLNGEVPLMPHMVNGDAAQQVNTHSLTQLHAMPFSYPCRMTMQMHQQSFSEDTQQPAMQALLFVDISSQASCEAATGNEQLPGGYSKAFVM